MWTAARTKDSKKFATTNPTLPSAFLSKGFAESFHGVRQCLRHEQPVSLHGPEINLSLLQICVFQYCLTSLCVGHMDLHFGKRVTMKEWGHWGEWSPWTFWTRETHEFIISLNFLCSWGLLAICVAAICQPQGHTIFFLSGLNMNQTKSLPLVPFDMTCWGFPRELLSALADLR